MLQGSDEKSQKPVSVRQEVLRINQMVISDFGSG